MTDILRALKEIQLFTSKIDPALVMLALVVSLAASLVASWLYAYFYERRGTGSQIHRAFPLLGLSITTLFIGIQVSLPLSLGLLGALSIIRFRTPIKDPEEVGFIMLVIAASITCATFNFQFLAILYGLAVLTLFLMRGRSLWRNRGRDGILIAALPAAAAEGRMSQIEDSVRQNSRSCFLDSCTTRDGLVSLQFSFSGLKKNVADFQAALAQVAKFSSVNIFFTRPGGSF